jgi:hypothetical protein
MIWQGNRSVRNNGRGVVVAPKRRFLMKLASTAAAVAAIMILISPVASFGQSAGGSSAGGSGSAAGSPSAGSAGAGSQGTSGVPPGPAAPGGLNNAGEDPSGAANASRFALPPAPGTNSAGTAQSSGAGANTGSGVTTGSGRGAGSATDMVGPQTSGDAEINAENKEVDRKIKSICRGC